MVQEKGWQAHDAWFPSDCDAADYLPAHSKTLQQLAGGALQSRRGPQHGHVPGRQGHEVVWMLRRVVEQATEWQIPVFVMDCDVAAAFDHVSHHGIIEATLAMGVPADADCRLDQRVQELRDDGEARRFCDPGNSSHKIGATR